MESIALIAALISLETMPMAATYHGRIGFWFCVLIYALASVPSTDLAHSGTFTSFGPRTSAQYLRNPGGRYPQVAHHLGNVNAKVFTNQLTLEIIGEAANRLPENFRAQRPRLSGAKSSA